MIGRVGYLNLDGSIQKVMSVNSVEVMQREAQTAIQAKAKLLCCSVNMTLSHVGTQSLHVGSQRSVQVTFSYLAYLAGHVEDDPSNGSAVDTCGVVSGIFIGDTGNGI